MTAGALFSRPTSVIICGTSRSLLNWAAYALAAGTDPDFLWTDVRLSGEVVAPEDPLSRDLIPSGRLRLVSPAELRPDDATANAALSAVIRDDDTPEELERAVEFLRLPSTTQDVLAEAKGDGSPRVVVLSNGHRLVAIYNDLAVVRPTVRAIVGAGVALIMTFADAPPGGREAFEIVLHVEGSDPTAWRLARLRVEKAPPDSIFPAGSETLLADVGPIASVLRREFP
ncbi:MAG TPA: hypothetical protein VEG66_03175 [Thermoplasmata archaeon]|nr:hypothetical protein [Thermoplasmata archaeon]